MTVNWPLIAVLFCLSVPGVVIVMSRLIHFLLPKNTQELQQRFSRFAVIQTLIMVLVMSFAGAVLSSRTGLNDPVLVHLLNGKFNFYALLELLLPTFLFTFFGFFIFCGLCYGVVESILDKHSLKIMEKLRAKIGLDGCVLYGGVVEEVIGRWGLLNLVLFFSILFAGQNNNFVICFAIILSGLLFGAGQIPLYIAAGCTSNRRLAYCVVLLSFCQSIIFGLLYWQYGIVSSMLGHMMFHIGWAIYDKH